jgi:hypothetical protein
MSTYCAAAAPTRHPAGEAHSPPAPAPLVTTFAAGPLPANSASKVAARRLAAHPIRTRRPLSPSLSLSATPQLPPPQPLSTRVAKNVSRRHTTRDTRHQATPGDTRHNRPASVPCHGRSDRRSPGSPRAAAAIAAPADMAGVQDLRSSRRSARPRWPTKSSWPTWPPWPPWPPRQNQAFFHPPRPRAALDLSPSSRLCQKIICGGFAQKVACGRRLRRRFRSPPQSVVVAQRRFGVRDPSHRLFVQSHWWEATSS